MASKKDQLRLWSTIFEETTERVASRIDHGVLTTEDTIRYIFTLHASKHLESLDHLVLEHPHAALPGKEIDLTILKAPLGPAHVEFKYHRPIPSGRNLPVTQLFGSILTDFVRLGLCSSRNLRIFVYFVHGSMRKYLERRSDVPLLKAGTFTLDGTFWAGLPATAKNGIAALVGSPVKLPTLDVQVLSTRTDGELAASLLVLNDTQG